MSLDKLQFFVENTYSFSSESFQVNDVSPFTEWVVKIDNVLKVFETTGGYDEDTIVLWAQLKLSGQLQVWASTQKFGSWAELKYGIFNQLFPLRTSLKFFVLPYVNDIKGLISGDQSGVFSVATKFFLQINQLYSIVAPFEPEVKALTHLSNPEIPALIKELRGLLIQRYSLYLKPEEELTEEEEEQYLEGGDKESKEFWQKFEAEIKPFIIEAQTFALAVNNTSKKIEEVKISRIAYKIVKNL